MRSLILGLSVSSNAFCGSASIVINGKSYDTEIYCGGTKGVICNTTVKNGKVFINGKRVDTIDESSPPIEIKGALVSLESDNEVTVNGNVGSYVRAGNSVTVSGDVRGNVEAGNSVTAGRVLGKASAGNSVNCAK